ncbi:MAG TPA: L-threonylcarbamoyladenylate synthase [Allosphingosinicella sp.]|nr:L-threonylcarbamoyladenylate synthase [Allosphingosinicella sp.]
MSAQNTRVVPFGDEALAEAARLIRSGRPVAVPTETVYGLAADATSAAAVARIFEAKGRPSFNPLIVHVESLVEAERLGIFSDGARALADAFWPGALTLVVPVREDGGLAAAVTAGLPTVALRCPAHPAMQALLAAAGRPLAAPSANASGAISPTRSEHVLASLGGRIPLILDGGATEQGLESTIVAVEEGRVRLLRPGPISLEDIDGALSPPCKGGAGGGSAEGGRNSESVEVSLRSPAHPQPLPSREGRIEAPGQMRSHYAPVKPVRLNVTEPAPDEWLIGFGPVEGDDNLSLAGDLAEAAAGLFEALHRADAEDRPRIAVAPIPDRAIGLAINDRLTRAAAPRT